MSLSTRTIVPKKKDQAGLVAVAFGPNEIMLRSAGAVNYGQEKLLARVIAGSDPAEPVHLVVRTDTLERFGVNVVLDDGKGNQTPMLTFEFDEKTPGGYTVTEYCPHCETEVEMVWSPKVSGFDAFCPFCGKRIMLCDACRHADEYGAGEPCVNCDQDADGNCCRHQEKLADNNEFSNKIVTVLCRGSELDGSDTFALRVLVLRDPMDLEDAVREAANEYLHTSDGFAEYASDSGCFTWYDFARNVSNDICRKHGFELVRNTPICDYTVDRWENLVDISELFFHVTNINWDTDGKDIADCDLPNEENIPFSELMDGEDIQDLELEDLKDRIADYLSDKYGFCVDSFSAVE